MESNSPRAISETGIGRGTASAIAARGGPPRRTCAERRPRHEVTCPYCTTHFELFDASWCEHYAPEPSKVCPDCRRCLCDHPAYAEPHFWKEAPPIFQRQGFRRLFLLYL